jgi:OTU domain-containing protein 5
MSAAGAASLAPPAPSNLVSNGSDTFPLLETSSFMNQLPPEMFGLQDWDDTGILAQVLAASQQEYLDNLKRSSGINNIPSAGTRDAENNN